MAAVGTGGILFLVASLRTIRNAVEKGESDSEGYLTRALLQVPLVGTQLRTLVTRIHAIKRAEAESATRYKILTDHVAAAVMLHQSDGTILWCSPYTEVLTGYSLSEIYRNKESFLHTSVHEDDRLSLDRSLAIVSTGEPFQCRYRFYHRSGMTLWFETRTVPIFDSTIQDYVALSIAIDVTAHVSNQLQIEERNRDLHEFTYMISHDLKAPILTIKGMLGILAEAAEVKGSSETSEPLQYIAKAIARLEQLVQGVLELARVSSSEQPLVGVDLSPILTDVLNDYKQQVDESHAEIVIEEHLPPVLGTQTYLYQIFSNLLGNSIKYRDRNRPLRFAVTASRAASSRRRVQITITDTGRGIAPDKLDLIFKPFHRIGDSSIEGSGVGLASVKKLVEKLGGTITVESAPGVGTTFTIELRRAPEVSVGTGLNLQ
jgi:PAS domain S-box-containing protein